jgi:hypothetical protein
MARRGLLPGRAAEVDLIRTGERARARARRAADQGALNRSPDQGAADGSRAGPDRAAGDRTPVEFGPFVRYWNIKQSDTQAITFNGVTVANGYEPANHTTEIGLGMKVWF